MRLVAAEAGLLPPGPFVVLADMADLSCSFQNVGIVGLVLKFSYPMAPARSAIGVRCCYYSCLGVGVYAG